MGRKRDRQSGQGLLPRMEARPWKDGKTVTYRYKPIAGPAVALGTDKIEAIRKVLTLIGKRETCGTCQWVWERWKDSPHYRRLSEPTRVDYEACSKPLLKVFGEMQISTITAPMIARYMRKERADAPVRANREKSLLSNLFAHGIDEGVCEQNPTRQVKPNHEEPRTKAPAAPTLQRFLDWLANQSPQRQVVGMAAEYCSLAGNRKVEFLQLCWPQIDEEHQIIRVLRAKQRGKKRETITEIVHMGPKLVELIARLKSIRRVDCFYVFPNRDNNPYTSRGFMTLWQHCMLAAIDAKVLTNEERFTFHDLRAYYVTVHKRSHGTLPDLHSNPGTTARIYDRNTEVERGSF